MKGSEALLRAINTAGGTIDGVQVDKWLGQLVDAGLLEIAPGFQYKLTETAQLFLQKKGVDV
jgi:hypothetical protein